MKNTFYLALALLFFNNLPAAMAGTTISCSHPEICRLAEIIYHENQAAKNIELQSAVKIVGDPHEYEPTAAEVKKLIKAPLLISGPQDLNPWIKKINYQRSKSPDLITINLFLDNSDYAFYAKGNRDALAHFWLYPQIFCSLKSKLEKELVTKKLLTISQPRSNCLAEEQKITSELKATIKSLALPVVLTHDALLPLLDSVAGNVGTIVAIKGSGHHQETSSHSVKKLYDALKSPKVIWIEETGINVPHNILSKKRKADLAIKIDTANSQGLHYFSILEDLNQKLKALKK